MFVSPSSIGTRPSPSRRTSAPTIASTLSTATSAAPPCRPHQEDAASF
uniref:Uncharacterized protein n=1 Tax=Arundo donax TaxID=35708 RepID=A0A0A8Y3M4_ARUDO